MIRVLLADDQALIRAGFRLILDTAKDIEVVGEATDGAEAVRLAKQGDRSVTQTAKDLGIALETLRKWIKQAELDAGEEEAARNEVGDLLFAVVNLARHLGCDPETALRATNAKFERRFHFIEQQLARRGKSPHEATLAEMDALWREAKASEGQPAPTALPTD